MRRYRLESRARSGILGKIGVKRHIDNTVSQEQQWAAPTTAILHKPRALTKVMDHCIATIAGK